MGAGQCACRKWIGMITGCERVLALSLALDAPETRISAPARVYVSVQWSEPLKNVGDRGKQFDILQWFRPFRRPFWPEWPEPWPESHPMA